MVRRAAEAGFNTLILQVRGRGDAYYRSRWEPPPPALAGRNGYDALDLTIREAHRRGLRVHAWINTQLVANADSLPTDSTHFIYRRPDLLAVPRPLARELYDADPRDPHYVQALAEYARANRDHVEGLYTSPAAPDVKEHLYSVWIDLVERYQLDGLRFDYGRYPGSTELFRQRIRAAVETAGGARVWAGIGAYKNTVDGTVEQIGVARSLGTAGVVLFSYDFMARHGGMRPGESYLLAVRDRAFR